mmetsp:Transcript_47254/g.119598  ORF Transcript_47254/g.119598 Transcript_47254/m.119598 type:complete len:359 (+) Transcript_47254:223-1299(+)|eukprot:jgi/Tetstr1/447700/TSEL_035057.t1
MANRTDPSAGHIHGTNPQNLVEKILRSKIYEQLYWKEHCFGLSAEGVVDKAVDLRAVGGTFGGTRKATDFMCLILKMLQIQPEKDIVVEFIKNEDYKYVRLLGAFYLRLVGRPLEVYQYLEPLYNDYRKVRVRAVEGGFQLSHVDELVDLMLTSDYMFDIALPRLPDRRVLEATGQLDPRQSVLDEEFDEAALEAEAGDAERKAAQLEAEIADDGGGGGGGRRRSGSPDDHDRERRQEREREKWRLRKSDRRSRSKSPRGRDRGRDDRDYDRDDRDRRDRDRDRGSRRDRDDRSRRSRSGSRERRSSRKERRSSRDRDRGSRRDRSRDRDDRGGGGEDVEIAEANALRAKLGIKPLRQ